MARRFHTYFTTVDCNHHLGLPVRVSCFILAIIAAAFNAYTLYFLPDVWRYIIMVYAAASGAVGVIATIIGFQFLTIIYLLAESLVLLPTGVVISYVFYTIINGHNCINGWNIMNNLYHDCPDAFTDYEIWLFTQQIGILWSALTVGVVSFPVVFTTLAGFRKLRLHQKGLGNVCHEEPTRVETHHHHHHSPTVVTAVPQPTILTTLPPQQTTIVAQPNFVVQSYQQPIQQEVAPIYPTTYQNPQVQPIAYLPYDKS